MSQAGKFPTAKPKLPPMAAGQRYGRLVAIGLVSYNRHRAQRWKYVCDCGREHTAFVTHVRRGLIRSCGCNRGELIRQKKVRHGMTGSAEYRVWAGMRGRCLNPNNHKFPDYGGRGIAICERWRTFENFYADMGPKPSPLHTIERRDNNRGYEPQNCVWGTQTEQARNRRSSRMLTYQGRAMSLAEAAELTGIPYTAIKSRLKLGWSVEKSLTQASRGKRTSSSSSKHRA